MLTIDPTTIAESIGNEPMGTVADDAPTSVEAGALSLGQEHDGIVRDSHETVDFQFASLGVQPGDVISFFAEAEDTAPEPHLARSQTVRLLVISVEEYNNFLREQTDIADAAAKYAALYGRPSGSAEDALKKGDLAILAFPDGFPNRGGLPIKVDGKTIGAIACSGAASEVDEAISQVAIDALLKP